MEAEERVRRLFAEAHGGVPDVLVRAPGHVNLIGDHTDYNDGFVLPIAIEQATWVAVRRRADRAVALVSEGHEPAGFPLDALQHGGPAWAEYVKGVVWSLGAADLTGCDTAIVTELPAGAGLSSSASLELGIALAFARISDLDPEPEHLARAAQRAENDWVGMACGIMDQLTVAKGVAGHALLIDCRSLAVTPHPVPPGVAVAVLDSGTRRRLVDSAYNERRTVCAVWRGPTVCPPLRDVVAADLAASPPGVSSADIRRARHVVSESGRVLDAAEAMAAGDVARLGRLMIDSHDSLRDDFEVSSPALDAVVEQAMAAPGCFGARMTGAGFGGSAVALVAVDAMPAFVEAMGGRPVLVTEASDGAAVMIGQDGGR